ncbi:hypothetical protein Q7C18_02900 [Nesterenkonia sp. CL21]|uniref:hypothetical protein n=1 Tax=Nesterenkonia sp. CL21 TaxID=3064894 RepID=UPI00287AF83B|nr:hypothetical protein [Nesterenkonia sp. CL21]MDS2171636.1 hypothetical protein [Nesterenkonia sp. CL21]
MSELPDHTWGVLIVGKDGAQRIVFCDNLSLSEGFLSFLDIDLELGEAQLMGGMNAEDIASYSVLPTADAWETWVEGGVEDPHGTFLTSDWLASDSLADPSNPYQRTEDKPERQPSPFHGGKLRIGGKK